MKKSYVSYDTLVDYNKILNSYRLVVKNTEHKNTFDNTFFENNNLLVIEGEVNSEVHECEVNNENANVTIYTASPLATADEEFNFNLYLIPINKNIPDNNINVEVTTYPDKEY